MTTITCSCESRNPGPYGAQSFSGLLLSQEHRWRKRFRRLCVPFVIALAACDPAPPPRQEPPHAGATLPTVPLVVATSSGERRFTVEVARGDEEQQRGLMQRRHLDEGGGMLFPFAYPRTESFWMKDTPLALDLLFVRPDGTIATILHGLPGDPTPLSAGEPVSAVVEIAGGEAKRLGVATGDRVRWGDCSAGADRDAEGESFCPAS